MDSQDLLPHAELRLRIRALRGELHVQRQRLASLIEACRATAGRIGAVAGDERRPRLFIRDVIRVGDAEVEMARQTIRHAGGAHRLTPTEWQLLTFFIAWPGTVHSREELAAGAWGPGFAERNSEVEVYVSRLRRKLGPAGPLLETVRGRGYRLRLGRQVDLNTGLRVLPAADGLATSTANAS